MYLERAHPAFLTTLVVLVFNYTEIISQGNDCDLIANGKAGIGHYVMILFLITECNRN